MKDLTLTPLGLRVGNKLLPCVIGKNGISKLKKEGDGKTPTGSHQIVGMLYRPDRINGHESGPYPFDLVIFGPMT